MPREGKGKRNGRKSAPAVRKVQPEEEEESDNSDEVTVTSSMNSDEEEEQISSVEKFGLMVRQGIEYAQEKSALQRVKGLTQLRQILQTRAAEDCELDNLHVTICDCIERCLKRGAGNAEKVAAVRLASMLMITSLNLTDGLSDEIYLVLQPPLLSICQDPTVAFAVREEACKAAAMLAYFGAVEYTHLQDTLNSLHNVFSKALPKGNGELPNLQAPCLLMHSAALQGFVLLLTLAHKEDVLTRTPSLLAELTSVLETRDLEMRTEAGVGVAMLFELARESPAFGFKRVNELLNVLNELATDSQKHRSKKERKTQRAVFRTIVTSIEEESRPAEAVYLAHKRAKDTIEIDSWAVKCRFDAVLHALEGGLNVHFIHNQGLRSSFGLDACPAVMEQECKDERKNRRRLAELMSKERNLLRNKCRDNRAIAVTYDD
ncbi:interferon-related developmental regulator 1 [Hyalella azteca]|uniref:Interferon-related developmental regulator 1 n=1 Tax=Hyalella azteca TaxID=294128 RepID=A0A8B7PAK5_HYAAZ|nr:interferon-related developmental regulator 1 [Hyalella azteca]